MTKQLLPYRISRVKIDNIRCFDKLDINFASKGTGGISNWNLLLGNNGVGKTTFLRCIAIALGDRGHAASLLRDSQGNWIPEGAKVKQGSIEVHLVAPNNGEKTVKVRVVISNEGPKEEIVKFSPAKSEFTNRIFVCAYGTSRSISATEDYNEYRALDAVYPLFQYSTALQSPELILRRAEEWGGNRKKLLEAIDVLLMLPKGSTKLSKKGLEISGPWNSSTQLETLGDGYRAMVNWLTDLIGWSIYYNNKVVDPKELYGIVLLDEIELNLHPIWQRKIINLLHEQFPNMQFIVTTHSPVSTLGMTDIKNEEEVKVFLFKYSEDGVTAGPMDLSLAKLRLDRILTSQLFQLRSISDGETEAKIQELASLPSSNEARTQKQIRREKYLIRDIRKSIAGSTIDAGGRASVIIQNSLEENLVALIKEDSDGTKKLGLQQPEALRHTDIAKLEEG